MQPRQAAEHETSATRTRGRTRHQKRVVWLSPYLLIALLSPVVLQSSTTLSCEKTGDTTLALLSFDVAGQPQLAFSPARRNYDVSLTASAGTAILEAYSADPGAQVGYQLSVDNQFVEGTGLELGGGEVTLELPLGRSRVAVFVKAPGGASDSYFVNISVGCSDCDDGNECTSDTCITSLQKCAHSPLTHVEGCSAFGLVWADSIQSGGWPYGFDEFQTERPIGYLVTPSDANGANLTRVADPQGGPGHAIRQYGAVNYGGARAELGVWSFQNDAFRELALSGAPVYVAQEWYFPARIAAGGDDWPWLSFLDWHTTSSGGENRWNTSPGIVLNEDGSMTFEFNWGNAPGATNGGGSGWSSIGMPIGEWFDIEMRWQFATSASATVSAWINGQLALEQTNVVTASPQHSEVEFYIKLYGDNQNHTPWSPNPVIKYVRNVRISGERLWQ